MRQIQNLGNNTKLNDMNKKYSQCLSLSSTRNARYLQAKYVILYWVKKISKQKYKIRFSIFGIII